MNQEEKSSAGLLAQMISTTEYDRHSSEYKNRVIYRGEHFVITRHGKPVAELRPVERKEQGVQK